MTVHQLGQWQRRVDGKVTYHHKSGDLVAFLTAELQKYGANLKLMENVSELKTDWRYAEDPDGFQVLLAQSEKDELVEALSKTFGEPMMRKNYPQLVYKEDRFGVGIMANLESDPIHIICLKKGVL